MATNTTPKMVKRCQRVAFMNTDTTGSAPKYDRMTKFSSLSNSKNPKEYSRQYVDQEFEESDVVGYAPSISYSFDRHTNTPVHETIAKIHDGELTGTETLVDIVVIDLFDPVGSAEGTYTARKRTWAVIPDADGDGSDALVYTGSFKAKSSVETGTATISADGKTLTYTSPNKA